PVVEEANRAAPAFAKIFKEMVIITDPARPLPRAAKGTIVRKQALAVYEREINNLYATVEQSGNTENIPPPPSWTVPDVQAWLQKHACILTNRDTIPPSKDLFDQGFDSLYATFLRNRIIGALRADPETRPSARHVSQNFVFEHPTLRNLAIAIGILTGQDVHSGAGAGAARGAWEESVRAMVDKYAADLPAAAAAAAAEGQRDGREVAVLLTGSTGAVGAHILASLLANPRIGKVYTLNRKARVTYDRQQTAFTERSLDPWLLEAPKLVQLTGDLNDDGFGLRPRVFEELKTGVTHVIHNAWHVDFNRALDAFECHVAGTRRLLDFCSGSSSSSSSAAAARSRPARLLFTSSVSATYRWDVARGPVPEEALPDPRVAAANGYGASKFVVEQVLARAAARGLECTAIRLGQVCGPEASGAWSAQDWLPILVKTSVNLGSFPDLTGTVSWAPADVVADTFVDLVLSAARLPPTLNLVHPHPVEWRAVVRALNASLGSRGRRHSPLPVVPYAAWLAAVAALPMTSFNMDRFVRTLLPFSSPVLWPFDV
ncbi:uncharacterized protein PHACADRAFT_108873, partial [Phanerochaete carnosa HHB-10118-sp]